VKSLIDDLRCDDNQRLESHLANEREMAESRLIVNFQHARYQRLDVSFKAQRAAALVIAAH
jgi:hypothetical protein